ncbi:MAG TPA: signal peptidase II [Chloroflexota bacterium]|nr:signal peptidase II [Chloroflexota bacterium]
MKLSLPPLPAGRRRVEPGVLATALVVLILDQVTKYIISHTLGQPGQVRSVEVIGNWVRLSYTTNTGAAFGIFPAGTLFFSVVAVIAAPVILLGRSYVRERAWWMTVIFGMLMGGALGNLLDRVRMGHVVDFIDVGIGNLRWPSFNVADSSFVVAVILLAVFLSFSREESSEETSQSNDSQRSDQPYPV